MSTRNPENRDRGPEASFRYGAVSASVFLNEFTRSGGPGGNVRRVVLQKTYRDKDGAFQHSNSYDLNDVPRAVLAMQEAYRHCLIASREERENHGR